MFLITSLFWTILSVTVLIGEVPWFSGVLLLYVHKEYHDMDRLSVSTFQGFFWVPHVHAYMHQLCIPSVTILFFTAF